MFMVRAWDYFLRLLQFSTSIISSYPVVFFFSVKKDIILLPLLMIFLFLHISQVSAAVI